jgi:hypothetical protein
VLIGGVEVVAGYALGGGGEPVTDAVALLVVALRWRR